MFFRVNWTHRWQLEANSIYKYTELHQYISSYNVQSCMKVCNKNILDILITSDLCYKNKKNVQVKRTALSVKVSTKIGTLRT